MIEEDEEDRLEEERVRLRSERSVYLTPGCCEEMRLFAPVVALCERVDDEAWWHLRLTWDHEYDQQVFDRTLGIREPQPKCCPYCGTAVPELVRRADPPQPLHEYDGHGRCVTCSEWCMNCACWPPWAAWEVKR